MTNVATAESAETRDQSSDENSSRPRRRRRRRRRRTAPGGTPSSTSRLPSGNGTGEQKPREPERLEARGASTEKRRRRRSKRTRTRKDQPAGTETRPTPARQAGSSSSAENPDRRNRVRSRRRKRPDSPVPGGRNGKRPSPELALEEQIQRLPAPEDQYHYTPSGLSIRPYRDSRRRGRNSKSGWLSEDDQAQRLWGNRMPPEEGDSGGRGRNKGQWGRGSGGRRRRA